jgi:hypothetical protein
MPSESEWSRESHESVRSTACLVKANGAESQWGECEIHLPPSNNGRTVSGETHESTAKTLREVELNEKKTAKK